jgi:hypothetical protein
VCHKSGTHGFGAEVDRVICPSTVTGRSCAAGFVRIGAYPKRNSRFIWVSSSLCTTSASEAKRCCLHSLSYWSRKTLESNMSDSDKLSDGVIAAEAPESNAKTASYCPAPCLATPPDDSYTAVVRHSHSSPSGLVPAPAHGGNRTGERRNAPQCCCVRPATLASHACVRPC